jgi:hypothetical protein
MIMEIHVLISYQDGITLKIMLMYIYKMSQTEELDLIVILEMANNVNNFQILHASFLINQNV